MIGVQLNHEIIIGVAIMVIKESKVAFFALRSARPAGLMIVNSVFPSGNHYSMVAAPSDRSRSWILVREPSVMRISLTQHGFQSFPNKRERLGRHLCNDHCNAIPGGNGIFGEGTRARAKIRIKYKGRRVCQPITIMLRT
jgi:hypothetical protein